MTNHDIAARIDRMAHLYRPDHPNHDTLREAARRLRQTEPLAQRIELS